MAASPPLLTTVTLEELATVGRGVEAPDSLTRRVLARGNGTFVIQASLPADREVPPHGLPAKKAAIITLLRGELAIGLGEAYDASALRPLEQGGMAIFRPDDPKHFARTGPEGADILLVAFEPEAATDLFRTLSGG